jgi:hypothetical protein
MCLMVRKGIRIVHESLMRYPGPEILYTAHTKKISTLVKICGGACQLVHTQFGD